jgi:hypothetical protein
MRCRYAAIIISAIFTPLSLLPPPDAITLMIISYFIIFIDALFRAIVIFRHCR